MVDGEIPREKLHKNFVKAATKGLLKGHQQKAVQERIFEEAAIFGRMLTEPAATSWHAVNLSMRTLARPLHECKVLVIGAVLILSAFAGAPLHGGVPLRARCTAHVVS
jgi:hypothetical protein